MLVRTTTLRAIGLTPTGEMVWPRNSALVAPRWDVDGEDLQVALAKRLETRSDGADVVGGAEVKY